MTMTYFFLPLPDCLTELYILVSFSWSDTIFVHILLEAGFIYVIWSFKQKSTSEQNYIHVIFLHTDFDDWAQECFQLWFAHFVQSS